VSFEVQTPGLALPSRKLIGPNRLPCYNTFFESSLRRCVVFLAARSETPFLKVEDDRPLAATIERPPTPAETSDQVERARPGPAHAADRARAATGMASLDVVRGAFAGDGVARLSCLCRCALQERGLKPSPRIPGDSVRGRTAGDRCVCEDRGVRKRNRKSFWSRRVTSLPPIRSSSVRRLAEWSLV